jgi:hypothetical protein
MKAYSVVELLLSLLSRIMRCKIRSIRLCLVATDRLQLWMRGEGVVVFMFMFAVRIKHD